jgi:hypothetical protein
MSWCPKNLVIQPGLKSPMKERRSTSIALAEPYKHLQSARRGSQAGEDFEAETRAIIDTIYRPSKEGLDFERKASKESVCTTTSASSFNSRRRSSIDNVCRPSKDSFFVISSDGWGSVSMPSVTSVERKPSKDSFERGLRRLLKEVELEVGQNITLTSARSPSPSRSPSKEYPSCRPLTSDSPTRPSPNSGEKRHLASSVTLSSPGLLDRPKSQMYVYGRMSVNKRYRDVLPGGVETKKSEDRSAPTTASTASMDHRESPLSPIESVGASEVWDRDSAEDNAVPPQNESVAGSEVWDPDAEASAP